MTVDPKMSPFERIGLLVKVSFRLSLLFIFFFVVAANSEHDGLAHASQVKSEPPRKAVSSQTGPSFKRFVKDHQLRLFALLNIMQDFRGEIFEYWEPRNVVRFLFQLDIVLEHHFNLVRLVSAENLLEREEFFGHEIANAAFLLVDGESSGEDFNFLLHWMLQLDLIAIDSSDLAENERSKQFQDILREFVTRELEARNEVRLLPEYAERVTLPLQLISDKYRQYGSGPYPLPSFGIPRQTFLDSAKSFAGRCLQLLTR